MNIGATGKRGEDMVAHFLRQHGCAVIKRNFQTRFGEIDMIAETSEYILFVEVKTRREDSMVSPAESVTVAKQEKIAAAAKMFLSFYETALQPRFDVAEVTVTTRPDGSEGYRLRYIKNAF